MSESPRRRFMVGLPIINDEIEWQRFLVKYKPHIYSVYFSLPLGDRFHSRFNVLQQFHDPNVVEQFWKLLKITESEGVELEMVLNTSSLVEGDVAKSKEELDAHGVSISSITISDKYYDEVSSIFHGVSINYSFNNHLENPDDIPVGREYKHIIIGRKNIRNYGMIQSLRDHGMDPVLLLNNGCNHFCGWCGGPEHCGMAFSRIEGEFDLDYLYALFSIMPYELDENPGWDDIRILKVSSRNSDVDFLDKCLDSYIHCKDAELVGKDSSNYFLWARLAWFSRYYKELNLEKIRAYKREINSGWEGSIYALSTNSVFLDLTGELTFNNINLEVAGREIIRQMHHYFRKDVLISGALIGGIVPSNASDRINVRMISSKLRTLRRILHKIILVVPYGSNMHIEEWMDLVTRLTEEELVDEVLVDEKFADYLRRTFAFEAHLYSVENRDGTSVLVVQREGREYVMFPKDKGDEACLSASVRQVNGSDRMVVFSPRL